MALCYYRDMKIMLFDFMSRVKGEILLGRSFIFYVEI